MNTEPNITTIADLTIKFFTFTCGGSLSASHGEMIQADLADMQRGLTLLGRR
jgi:hypothetical protein